MLPPGGWRPPPRGNPVSAPVISQDKSTEVQKSHFEENPLVFIFWVNT